MATPHSQSVRVPVSYFSEERLTLSLILDYFLQILAWTSDSIYYSKRSWEIFGPELCFLILFIAKSSSEFKKSFCFHIYFTRITLASYSNYLCSFQLHNARFDS